MRKLHRQISAKAGRLATVVRTLLDGRAVENPAIVLKHLALRKEKQNESALLGPEGPSCAYSC